MSMWTIVPCLAKFLDLAGHPVIEAHADREQQVGFVDGVVRIHRAVHAEPFEGKRVRLGKAADAHQRGRHVESACARRIRCNSADASPLDDAAAAVNHRLLRLPDEPDQFVDLTSSAFRTRVVTAELHLARVNRLRLAHLDVLRECR